MKLGRTLAKAGSKSAQIAVKQGTQAGKKRGKLPSSKEQKKKPKLIFGHKACSVSKAHITALILTAHLLQTHRNQQSSFQAKNIRSYFHTSSHCDKVIVIGIHMRLRDLLAGEGITGEEAGQVLANFPASVLAEIEIPTRPEGIAETKEYLSQELGKVDTSKCRDTFVVTLNFLSWLLDFFNVKAKQVRPGGTLLRIGDDFAHVRVLGSAVVNTFIAWDTVTRRCLKENGTSRQEIEAIIHDINTKSFNPPSPKADPKGYPKASEEFEYFASHGYPDFHTSYKQEAAAKVYAPAVKGKETEEAQTIGHEELEDEEELTQKEEELLDEEVDEEEVEEEPEEEEAEAVESGFITGESNIEENEAPDVEDISGTGEGTSRGVLEYSDSFSDVFMHHALTGSDSTGLGSGPFASQFQEKESASILGREPPKGADESEDVEQKEVGGSEAFPMFWPS